MKKTQLIKLSLIKAIRKLGIKFKEKKYPEAYFIIKDSEYFDVKWYKRSNPDVAAAGIDPVRHYLISGWKEGRNPSAQFNAAKYRAVYPDVERLDMNPLLHFETIGRGEHRDVEPTLEWKQSQLIKGFSADDPELIEMLKQKKKSGKKRLSLMHKSAFDDINVCYITTTGRDEPILDPSSRYRCYHPAEIIDGTFKCVSVMTSRAFVAKPCLDYDVYVFHRPSESVPHLKEIIKYLRDCNKILIADYDDLIFGDSELALCSSIYLNKRATAKQTISIFENNLKGLDWFDIVTCSTQSLAAQIKKWNPKASVYVLPNVIPPSIFEMYRDDALIHEEKDTNTIMYCSGTLSHNMDFKTVEPILLSALSKDPDLRLYLFGALQLSDQWVDHPQVLTHPPVEYSELFEEMKHSAITIAPLEDSMFNDCKSRVKFLESCLAGTTLFAFPITDMKEHGPEHIVLLEKESDWEDAILNRKQYISAERRQQNYDYLRKLCDTEQFVAAFTHILQHHSK